MKCSYCATALPSDSLFCGECGRTVMKKSNPQGRAELPPLSTPLPLAEPWMNASAAAVCTQCGFPILPDDIFCGECGFVVSPGAQSMPRGNDTSVIERREVVERDEEPDPEPEPEQEQEAEPEPEPEPEREPETEPELKPAPELKPDPESEPEAQAAAGFDERDATPRGLPDEVESTRIVPHPIGSERFVLQFSTGESFTVYGSGLIGRSPKSEPGEYFDQLVRIVDASRSVSKTHLEFGQESGSFWVKDRFSGNGTIIREPDAHPLRCRPDRRYRLVRGSRVDLGEQFFIVS